MLETDIIEVEVSDVNVSFTGSFSPYERRASVKPNYSHALVSTRCVPELNLVVVDRVCLNGLPVAVVHMLHYHVLSSNSSEW